MHHKNLWWSNWAKAWHQLGFTCFQKKFRNFSNDFYFIETTEKACGFFSYVVSQWATPLLEYGRICDETNCISAADLCVGFCRIHCFLQFFNTVEKYFRHFNNWGSQYIFCVVNHNKKCFLTGWWRWRCRVLMTAIYYMSDLRNIKSSVAGGHDIAKQTENRKLSGK